MNTPPITPIRPPAHPVEEYLSMAATTSMPSARVRVNHNRTQRDGWHYETTVEVEWQGDAIETDAAAIARLGGLLETARVVAEQERDVRNAQEATA